MSDYIDVPDAKKVTVLNELGLEESSLTFASPKHLMIERGVIIPPDPEPEYTYNYIFNSQAAVDAVPIGASGPNKPPITFDSQALALRQTVLPKESKCSSEQGHPQIKTVGVPILFSFDLRLSASCKFIEKGYMNIHKAYRIDYRLGSNTAPWLSFKTDYAEATNKAQDIAPGSIAEFQITNQNTGFIPVDSSTYRTSDEQIVNPDYKRAFLYPDRWAQAWVHLPYPVDGSINLVDIYFADEVTDPFLIRTKMEYLTPIDGFAKFRLEYDSSLKTALNDPMFFLCRQVYLVENPGDIRHYLSRPRS